MPTIFDFGSEAWVEELKTKLNESEAYAEAAKNWEGDFYFIIEPTNSTLTEPGYLYLDLWHGKCRKAAVPQSPDEYQPEFTLSGTVKTFRQIMDDGMDPMKAIMTRKIKLQGNLAKIMRNVKAAHQLVHCCTQIPTRFPME